MTNQPRSSLPASPPTVFAVCALPFGALTGAAAGLIGVGGGEFRIPYLVGAYGQRVKTASAVNLVVGLVTVLLAIYRRVEQGALVQSDWVVAGLLVGCSLAGAVIGAKFAHRIRSEPLRKVVIGYLLLVGAWMLYESATQTDHVLLQPGAFSGWMLGALIGFVVGFISPIFGVAGGEMRIPALMYLLAIPVKEAGTLSLVASIPTVAAGALTYRQLGHMGRRELPLALLLGSGSVAGVFAGVALLPSFDPHVLKAVLGAILILAALALLLSRPHKQKHCQRPLTPRHNR